MKATELMIGDWVMNTYNRKPEQVCEIRERMVMLDYNDLYDYDEIEPIPLTSEILEQNGFVTKDKPDDWKGYRYYAYKNGSTCISFRLFHDKGIYKWSGKCEISLNAPPYWIRFEYLHELQNILKICGIDKEITIKED
jgi:hypothetical protein